MTTGPYYFQYLLLLIAGLREVFVKNRDGTYLQHNGEMTSIVDDAVLDDVGDGETAATCRRGGQKTCPNC